MCTAIVFSYSFLYLEHLTNTHMMPGVLKHCFEKLVCCVVFVFVAFLIFMCVFVYINFNIFFRIIIIAAGGRVNPVE